MNSINYIDIGIVILVLLSAIVGFFRGFVREAFSLTTWVAAGVAAYMFYEQLAEQLPFNISPDIARNGVAVLLIVVGVFVIGSLVNYLFSKAIKAVGLGGTDRVLGGAFGALRGALVVTLVVLLMGLGLTTFTDGALWKGSKLVPYFEDSAEWIKKEIPENAAEKIRAVAVTLGIESAMQSEQSEQSTQGDATQSDASSDAPPATGESSQ
ncbi:MAG TPA: CvpA family protein [Thiothrix sp.]|nr:CvpA family protein [Thiothrix sp.]